MTLNLKRRTSAGGSSETEAAVANWLQRNKEQSTAQTNQTRLEALPPWLRQRADRKYIGFPDDDPDLAFLFESTAQADEDQTEVGWPSPDAARISSTSNSAASIREEPQKGFERPQEIGRRKGAIRLPPLTRCERENLRKRLAITPKRRETLPTCNEFAKGICFRGVKSSSILGLRFCLEALRQTGVATQIEAARLTFEGTIKDFARVLDSARAGGAGRARPGYYASHFREIVDAIRTLDELRAYLLVTDEETGEDRLRRLPLIAEVDTPVLLDASASGARIKVEFNPGLVHLLRFDRSIARTLFTVDDFLRVRTPRAVTLLAQLSAHRHLALRDGRLLFIPLQRLRKLFDLRGTWGDDWKVLKAVARDVRIHTPWRFEMRTRRESGRVSGVEWHITEIDKDYRKGRKPHVSGTVTHAAAKN